MAGTNETNQHLKLILNVMLEVFRKNKFIYIIFLLQDSTVPFYNTFSMNDTLNE